MNLSRWSQIAEWALAAAVVLLHGAIFLWPERSGQAGFVLTTAHDAQLYGTIVLILAWVLLGPGWVWLRGVALPLLALAWFLPWNTRMIPRDTADWFFLAVTVSAIALVVGLRLCGLRVAKSAIAGGRERGAQFSILSMLIATTLIAAMVGALEALRPILSGNIDQLSSVTRYIFDSVEDVLRAPTIRALVAAIVAASAALGGVWVVLRPGTIWMRLAGLVVGLGVLGVYLPHLSGVATEEFTASAVNLSIALAAIAMLTGISVLPLRLLGFRLYQPAAAAQPARGRESIAATTLHYGKPRPQLTPDPLDVAPPQHVVSEPSS